jgi:hypothetical protein
MSTEQRHRLGCAILTAGAIALAAASAAILSPLPDLHTKPGRHLVAGALANLALAAILALVAAVPLRHGHRWAFWAYVIPFAIYGLPVLIMDSIYVSQEHLLATLGPQVVGLVLSISGLILVAPAVFGRSRGHA